MYLPVMDIREYICMIKLKNHSQTDAEFIGPLYHQQKRKGRTKKQSLPLDILQSSLIQFSNKKEINNIISYEKHYLKIW